MNIRKILADHVKWLDGVGGSRAYLSGADLSRAYLSGADLRRADLSRAYLSRADLSGADLSGTCLDLVTPPSGAGENWERHRTRSGQAWVRGWRTLTSTHVGDTYYAPGLHEAPYFSTSADECHPGLYLWPTKQQAVDWAKGAPVVEAWTFAHEIHEAGDKARARWLIAGGGRWR